MEKECFRRGVWSSTNYAHDCHSLRARLSHLHDWHCFLDLVVVLLLLLHFMNSEFDCLFL